MKIGSRLRRITIICLLALILAVSCFYYSFEYNDHLEYPSYKTILDSYPVGKVVYIHGSVIEKYHKGYDLIDTYHGQNVITHISDTSSPQLGDEVSLLGVLEPSYHISNIKKIRIISWWKYEFELKRSFAAIIFLILIFIYYWKLDFRKLVFKRR